MIFKIPLKKSISWLLRTLTSPRVPRTFINESTCTPSHKSRKKHEIVKPEERASRNVALAKNTTLNSPFGREDLFCAVTTCNLRGIESEFTSVRHKLYKNYDYRLEIDIPLCLHIRLDAKNNSLEDEIVIIILSRWRTR